MSPAVSWVVLIVVLAGATFIGLLVAARTEMYEPPPRKYPPDPLTDFPVHRAPYDHDARGDFNDPALD